jgi:hypothetical protein
MYLQLAHQVFETKISEERPLPKLGCVHHWPPSHRAAWIPTCVGGDWTIPECKRRGASEGYI